MAEAIDIVNMSTVQAPAFDAALNTRFRVHAAADSIVPPAALKARALIPGGRGADAAIIDALPALEIISLMGVGYDRVDMAHAARRGIAVTNTPDVLTDDVADLAIAMMIMVSRQLVMTDRLVRAGGWKKDDPVFGSNFTGKRIGILGFGRIGKAIAARAQAMKADIAYTSHQKADTPYRFMPDVLALAQDSDYLVVAASGRPDTRHIVNAAVLEALGANSILINVARGPMVDEAALIAALQQNVIGGAGLDVFEHEPQVPQALLGMNNVVLSPHIGSGTVETRMAMGQLVLDNLTAHFEGRALLSEVPESREARQNA